MKKNMIFRSVPDLRAYDTRKLNIQRADIQRICEDFHLGLLKDFEEEKGISVSHSNFVIFVAAQQGEFVLKFTKSGSPNDLIKEYLLNRTLTRNDFPTPAMRSSKSGRPFVVFKKYLVTCYVTIPGSPLDRLALGPKELKQINKSLYDFNRILLKFYNEKRLFHRADFRTFPGRVRELRGSFNRIKTLPLRKEINGIFKKILRARLPLAQDPRIRPLHSNLHLSNILYHRKRFYLLDLSHAGFDYEMSDLAGLVVSCYLFNMPQEKIDILIDDFFRINRIPDEKIKLLLSFIVFRLLKEYLKILKRENSLKPDRRADALTKNFKSQLKERRIDLAGLARDLAKKI